MKDSGEKPARGIGIVRQPFGAMERAGTRYASQLGLIREAQRLVLARLGHSLDGGVHVRHHAGRIAAGTEQILMWRGQTRDTIGRLRDVGGRPPTR
jgi:hypothetical protein